MFQYFHLENHALHRSLFAYFDQDGSGYLNLAEFICTLWDLLTAKNLGLIFFNMVHLFIMHLQVKAYFIFYSHLFRPIYLEGVKFQMTN